MAPKGTKVHFLNYDSYIPFGERGNTPSPTLSTSTLDSPELSSPPSLPPISLPHINSIPYGSPSGSDYCARLPSTSPTHDAGTLELDRALRVPGANQLPLFTLDLMRDPQGPYAVIPPLPQATLDSPAVTPPVAKMTIVVTSPFLPNPWSIEIKSSRRYVTVKDVLHGIYYELQKGLQESILEYMTPEASAGVRAAAFRRCERMKKKKDAARDAPEMGLKRLDLLDMHSRFKGIAYDPMNGVWVLHVEEQA